MGNYTNIMWRGRSIDGGMKRGSQQVVNEFVRARDKVGPKLYLGKRNGFVVRKDQKVDGERVRVEGGF